MSNTITISITMTHPIAMVGTITAMSGTITITATTAPTTATTTITTTTTICLTVRSSCYEKGCWLAEERGGGVSGHDDPRPRTGLPDLDLRLWMPRQWTL
eukprot:1972506-Pyramimonas_sp.AAC.1